MSHEIKLHTAQTSILRELLFQPSVTYAGLQKPTGLSSDHFSFHINRLVELDLVEKPQRGTYRLTPKGKEYANRLDTDNSTVERQPKVSVILVIWRDESRTELLLQERLKNPYYGFWGYPTGKVRWGETILAAAERELLEETNLSARFSYHGIYHEHAYKNDLATLLEDKIFLITSATSGGGKLSDAEGCHNEWVTLEQARQFEKTFPGFDTVQAIVNGEVVLSENEHKYEPDHF